MEWGIQTWGTNGAPNNYRIKPISVVDIVSLLANQKIDSYFSNLELGLEIDSTVGVAEAISSATYASKRNILASGNIITIQLSTSGGANDYPANQVWLIAFTEKV